MSPLYYQKMKLCKSGANWCYSFNILTEKIKDKSQKIKVKFKTGKISHSPAGKRELVRNDVEV